MTKSKVRNYVSVEPKYFIVGYIIYESKETSARKRLVRHHLKMVDGIVNAYVQVINLEERLERVRNCNILAVGIG